MKRFSRILFYLRDKKQNIGLYILFNLSSVLFSLVSFALLPQILKMLFSRDKIEVVKVSFKFSANGVQDYINYHLSLLVVEHNKIYALAFICVLMVISVFLKNVFIYLSYRVLAPMRNYVMTKLRSDLYAKILELPIGFFTEQRKGDIISRMSNDANEIEWSVMSTLEGLIRDPLQIIIVLTLMVLMSPTLSLFLLVLLPIAGFIIGRVSRSLKKNSTVSQEQLGTLMSILDETLGGLRVIKAFNAEKILRSKFFHTNDTLNDIRNRMNFRRDLASPLSEFLGVLVLSVILYFLYKLSTLQNLYQLLFIMHKEGVLQLQESRRF